MMFLNILNEHHLGYLTGNTQFKYLIDTAKSPSSECRNCTTLARPVAPPIENHYLQQRHYFDTTRGTTLTPTSTALAPPKTPLLSPWCHCYHRHHTTLISPPLSPPQVPLQLSRSHNLCYYHNIASACIFIITYHECAQHHPRAPPWRQRRCSADTRYSH